MANTIRIKRSTTTNSPVSLLQGELAFSEDDSPNGLHQLFIGTAASTITTIMTDDATTRGGTAAAPNDSNQDNQTITTGLGLDGADAGSSGNITIDFAPVELTNVAPVAADQFVFNDATDDTPKKQVASSIPLSIFSNDSGWEANQTITTGLGLDGADAGSTGNITIDFAPVEFSVASLAGNDYFVISDVSNVDAPRRVQVGGIGLNLFSNDIFATIATFAFDSGTTQVDPGAGELRYNNATPASVTELYIDDVEENGNDWGWVLSNLAVNDIIIIKSIDDPADYMICQVDAATTDNTGYWTVPVNPLFTGSLPTAADRLSLEVQWFSQGTAGTVTSVTAGNGLINTGTASAVVLDLDFSELTDMTGNISGTTEFILQNGTTESRKAASEIQLSFFNNDSGWEANQTITTGTGIDGADAGSTGNVTLSLAFDEVGVTTAVAGDWIMFDDAGVSSKFLISAFNVGLFDNTIAEYVSENDTLVVADWNWVLDEDTLVSDSATHLPTQQSVKAYVDSAVSSALKYQGGYDANTNTPDLDTSPSGISTGDTYTVTAAGDFFTEAVQIGDMLIAEQDNPTLLSHWTVVQDNIGPASETAAGYAELATQAETDGATDDARIVTPLKLHSTTFDGGSF